MNKVAIFSNGHTDTYKGKRPVAAAWMITEKATGKVYASGHSLTRDHAEKTARANIPRKWNGNYSNKALSAVQVAKLWRQATEAGFQTIGELFESRKRDNAAHAELYAIEVVDL